MTDEPKIYEVSGGHKKASFSLALNRMKEGADFPSFIAWDQKAELVEKYCHKGSKLLIVGHVQTGSYEKDDKKIYRTDLVVDRLEFLDKKPKDGTEGQPAENQAEPFMNIPENIDEEIPFG